MDFSSKVAPLKREYGSLFTSISEALFKANPAHLNYEVNTDEYDSEVATIIPRLSSAKSALDVETILKEELLRCLGNIGVSTDNLTQKFGCSGVSSIHGDGLLGEDKLVDRD